MSAPAGFVPVADTAQLSAPLMGSRRAFVYGAVPVSLPRPTPVLMPLRQDMMIATEIIRGFATTARTATWSGRLTTAPTMAS